MANGVELATAYVTITVSAKGIAADLDRELGAPVKKAAESAGNEAGKSLTSSFDKVSGGLTKVGTVAVAAATGAGLALNKFAGDFEDLALKSNKFALATGVNVDEASRWIEVTGDLGIESDALQSSLGKLNKAALESPENFKAIGAEIVRTKDGAVDVNETFLSTVDALNAIQDPAEKQVAATKLLGRGWQSMAELIGEGSDKLRDSLASVSDAKAIDDAEVQKAKDYRASMDTLGDSVQDLTLAIGQGAAPVIGALAKGLAGVVDILGKADAVTGGFVGSLGTIAAVGIGAIGALASIAGQAMKLRDRFTTMGEDGVRSLNNMGRAAQGVGIAMGLTTAAVAAYSIGQQQAAERQSELNDRVSEFTRVSDDAFGAYFQDTLTKAVLDMALSGTQLTEFFANMARTSLEGTKRALEWNVAHQGNKATIEALTRAIANEEAAQEQARRTNDEYSTSVTGTTRAVDVMETAFHAGIATTANFGITMGGMGLQASSAAEALRSADRATQSLNDHYSAFIGVLDHQDAWVNAQKAVDLYIWKMADASATTGDQEQALRDAQRELSTYVQGLDDMPEERKTELLTEIEAGHLQAVRQILGELEKPKDVWFNARLNTAAYLAQQAAIGHGYASGTDNATPGYRWVGENGPELLRFRGGEQVLNHHDSVALARSSADLMQGTALDQRGSQPPLVVNNYRRDIGVADLNQALAMARLAS